MIDIMFRQGGEYILVKVNGNSILFANSVYGFRFADISGLKLNKEGVIKEFPDLEGQENWREKAIQRFKNHIKNLGSEKEKANYIIYELKKFGYSPRKMQEAGKRWRKLDGDIP